MFDAGSHPDERLKPAIRGLQPRRCTTPMAAVRRKTSNSVR
jgi:hypothetical protein